MEEATIQSEQSSEAIAQESPAVDTAANEMESRSATENLRAFKKGSAEPKPATPEPEANAATAQAPAETQQEPVADNPKVDVKREGKKESTPSQLREARIKELKQQMRELKEKAANADIVSRKLAEFEQEKMAREQARLTQENYYEKASEEGIPDAELYKDLMSYYAEHVDTPIARETLGTCKNPHGSLYCIAQWLDESPKNLELWKSMSPMAIKREIKRIDQAITDSKAQKAMVQVAAPAQASSGQTAAAPAAKPIPKAVVAETSDSTSPGHKRDIKGLKPADALRHFKMHGASGSFDE